MKGEIKIAKKLIAKNPELNMRDARKGARALLTIAKLSFSMVELENKLKLNREENKCN